ncbi:MAG: penicillin-binding protein 2, partial [Acidimicrobiales bacterium]
MRRRLLPRAAPAPGDPAPAHSPRLRIAALGVIALSLFAALYARLWYLQIMAGPTYEQQVTAASRYRRVQYAAERGRLLDRAGRVLVDNREAAAVTIDRDVYRQLEDKSGLILRLARRLNEAGILIKAEDIERRLNDARFDPLKPAPIVDDVDADLERYLLERSYEFPSVDVERHIVRTYPYGHGAAHLLGYVGKIREDELEARQASPSQAVKQYQGGDETGQTGIERSFEDDLRGVPGNRVIQIDARNRPVATASETPAEPGADVQLTIDIDLQVKVEELLAQTLEQARRQPKERSADPDFTAPAGSVVVLDAQTGEILASASYPTYDPGEFVGGISDTRFRELNDPASHFPLLNRAIQSTYAPGSTFKLITAYAGLASGVISAGERVDDGGSYRIERCRGEKCEFRNSGGTAYGPVDLRKALTVSSDVYFYRLGERFWVDKDQYGETALQDVARVFGFGALTQVQLPSERAGLISDPAFKARRHDQKPQVFPDGDWRTGDNVNLAIGQGDVGVTPLQLASAYGAFANGGGLFAPNLARAVRDPATGAAVREFGPRELHRVDLPPALRDPILAGLLGAVRAEEGTAYAAFGGFPLDRFPLAGKTGTAQVSRGRADTALFVAFGPVPEPRYVVAAVLEEAGFAARTAAPLVRAVFEQLEPVKALGPTAPAARRPAEAPDPSASAGPAPTAGWISRSLA